MTRQEAMSYECLWCEGTGSTPCDTPWCNDPSHDGRCLYCIGTGDVSAYWQPDRKRWLVPVPVWAVPFRVTLDNPTTSPQETS